MKRTQISILMYHALDETRSSIAIPSSVFAWQMQWLYDHDCSVIPLGRLVRYLYGGDPIPPRSIVVTFDDGFESVYDYAFPILSRYDFSATVFLVPGYCGQQNDWPGQPLAIPCSSLLSWSQIREMDRQGIEFGAHSLSHPRLDLLSSEMVAQELLDSKACIQDQLGHSIELFAYPYGWYSEAVKAVVRGAYAGACTTRPGVVDHESDPFALDRIDALYVVQPVVFRQLMSPLFPAYVGLRRLLRTAASFILQRPWR